MLLLEITTQSTSPEQGTSYLGQEKTFNSRCSPGVTYCYPLAAYNAVRPRKKIAINRAFVAISGIFVSCNFLV